MDADRAVELVGDREVAQAVTVKVANRNGDAVVDLSRYVAGLYRPGDRDRDRRHGARCVGVPIGSPILGLAGSRPRTAFDRRQAKTGQDIETRRWLSTPVAGHRRDSGVGALAADAGAPLGSGHAQATSQEAGRRRPGQQNGAHRLDGDDHRRGLPRAKAGHRLSWDKPLRKLKGQDVVRG